MNNFVWILVGGDKSNRLLETKMYCLVEYIDNKLFLSDYKYNFHLSLSSNNIDIVDNNDLVLAILQGKKFLIKFNESDYGYYTKSNSNSKIYDIVYFDKETCENIKLKLMELLISECMFIF